MEKLKRDENGCVDIPLEKEVNVIVAKGEKKFLVQKVIIHLDENLVSVERIEEPFDVSHKEAALGEKQFLVIGSGGLDSPQKYQLLEYDWEKGFTSDGENYYW